MWNWFNCYLSGRHDFGVSCGSGAIFLHCVHCGRRSSGWAVDLKPKAPPVVAARGVVTATKPQPRILPFDRAAAR